MLRALLLCIPLLHGAEPAPRRPVPELARAVHSTDAREQSRAMKELGAWGNAEAVKVLVPLVEDPALRGNALYALKQARDPAAAPLVQPLLAHKEGTVRGAAATILGNLGDRGSAPLLLRVVTTEPEGYVKHQAIPALARLASTEEQLRALLDLLPDRRWTEDVQRALRDLREPALAPFIVPLLKDPEPRTRHLACDVLAQLGNPVTAVALMDSVERDEDPQVQGAAAAALGTVADASALPRLVRILKGGRRSQRGLVKSLVQVDRANDHDVTRALVKEGGPLAREVVLAIHSDARPSDDVVVLIAVQSRDHDARREAVNALQYVKTPRARDALCRVLREETDPVIQGMAAESLEGHPGDETLRCLVDGFAHVKHPGPGSTGEDIQKTLRHLTGKDFEYDEKAWRAWVQGGLGARADQPGLQAALADADPSVKELAARQLARARDPDAATDALLAAADKERSSSTRIVMIESAAALRRPRAVEPLVRMLDAHPRQEERIAIVRALDDLGDARGTLKLVELLETGDEKERDEAAQALSAVTGEPAHRNAARWRAWWKAQAERYRRP